VLAEGLAELPGATIDASKVETNIVIFEVEDPAGVITALLADGVEMTQMGPGRIRAVTHMDVDRAGVERALEVLRKVLG
jgi:threonine aldolase